jgi:primosomal protein N' (replication factor Y) (superfamily II helicase)
MADAIQPGHMVQVAFRTQSEHGIVVSISDQRPADLPDNVQTKPVDAILHPQPVISPRQLELAQWVAQRYLASVASAIWLLLPPGFTGGRDILITLVDSRAAARNMFEHRVISLLNRRGALRGAQVSNALAGEKKADWQKTVDELENRGVVTVAQVLRPPRIRPRNVRTALLAINPDQIAAVGPSLGKRNRRADLLEAIAGMPAGPHNLKETAAMLGTSKNTLSKMADDGLLTIENDTVALAVSPDDIDEKLIELRNAEPQIRALRVLSRENTPIEVSWVYAQTGIDAKDLKQLEEAGLVLLGEETDWRDTMTDRQFAPNKPPLLTEDQQNALQPIADAITTQRHEAFLLHGVTGSGKTEIYLQAVQHALDVGKTALFLVPEIALTPQTASRVAGRFPNRVTVLHSGLSDGERYDAWRRAREGLVQVVVGARSALFAPLENIGVIVLDEEHDHSYKQSPNVAMPPFRSSPHYDARATAAELARLHHAVVIYGSATPDVESRYAAHQGHMTYLSLPDRILAHREQVQQQRERVGVRLPLESENREVLSHDLPPVEVVDMRAELKDGNTSIFSYALQDSIRETLMRGEQAILFLNRRGKSTYVFCRDCGYVSTCPNCDTPLIYHHDAVMRCHRCGHFEGHPKQCPACSSRRIKYFGAGTQQVENALKETFPGARVIRWDADTATEAASHEIYLRHFMDREADIMVGTQMIAKGLDLPLVTTVGIVSADTALNLPDFRAGERTFQLLTQVAGRAGRSLLGGRVVLQTYQPDHYAIQAAADHDYHTFYTHEISYRRELGYPPFRRMVRILFRYSKASQAQFEAEATADRLRKRIQELGMTGTELIGPAPCFFTKVGGYFRWHLLLRGPNPTEALRGMSFEKNGYVDVDTVDVL